MAIIKHEIIELSVEEKAAISTKIVEIISAIKTDIQNN